MMLVPSMEAFTTGNCRKAAVAARTTKGRNVRLNPYCAWNWPLILSRNFATRVISTLWTVVTCAEVCLLNTMCSAIFCRMVVIGSTRVAGISPVLVMAGGGGGTLTGCGDGTGTEEDAVVGMVVIAAVGCCGGGGGGGGAACPAESEGR